MWSLFPPPSPFILNVNYAGVSRALHSFSSPCGFTYQSEAWTDPLKFTIKVEEVEETRAPLLGKPEGGCQSPNTLT